MNEIPVVKSSRFILSVGLSAVVGFFAAIIVGAFNLGSSYRANQASLDDINAHISSLEKNYDSLNILVQDDRQAGRQIATVQTDMLRLAQSLQESTRAIAELATELSHVRETTGRIDERVLLLDEIIKHARKTGGLP